MPANVPAAPGASQKLPLKRVDHDGRRWLLQLPGPRVWTWTDGAWVEADWLAILIGGVPTPVLEAAESLRKVEGNGRDPGDMQVRR
jgi:hypothetical protein